MKSARKDNPVAKKGEPYYWWKFRYGGKHFSTTYPRSSQLTQSKLSEAYAALENLEDIVAKWPSDREDINASLEEIRDAYEEAHDGIEQVAEEYTDSADSIRSTFSESPTADECEEKAGSLTELADNLESIRDEIPEEYDPAEHGNLERFIGDQSFEVPDCEVG